MIDVDRLNNTITELEQQSEKMKTVSEFYKQLLEVSEEVVATASSQKEANKTIELIMNRITNLNEENKKLIKKIEGSNEKITKDVKDLQDEILKNVQALSSENNKLYLDFQQFLNSKLELFKSDVQLEIRETVSRLQNSLNNDLKRIEEEIKIGLNENKLTLNKIESTIMTSFEMQNKKIRLNQIIMAGVFIVSIISLILNLR